MVRTEGATHDGPYRTPHARGRLEYEGAAMTQSLKARALAAHEAAVQASEIQYANEQASKDAKHIIAMIRAWADVGVVVCTCSIEHLDNIGHHFERDGYRLSVALGDGDGDILMIHDDINREWTYAYSLEHLGARMAEIDAQRAEHYQRFDGWTPENQAAHLSDVLYDCHACAVREVAS